MSAQTHIAFVTCRYHQPSDSMREKQRLVFGQRIKATYLLPKVAGVPAGEADEVEAGGGANATGGGGPTFLRKRSVVVQQQPSDAETNIDATA